MIKGLGFGVLGLGLGFKVSGTNLFAVFSSPQLVSNSSIEGNISECSNVILP